MIEPLSVSVGCVVGGTVDAGGRGKVVATVAFVTVVVAVVTTDVAGGLVVVVPTVVGAAGIVVLETVDALVAILWPDPPHPAAATNTAVRRVNVLPRTRPPSGMPLRYGRS